MDELLLKKNFGLRLKALRSLRTLTQADLAEQTGLSVEYLSKIERGLSSPSFKVIALLCDTLRVGPADLFD